MSLVYFNTDLYKLFLSRYLLNDVGNHNKQYKMIYYGED